MLVNGRNFKLAPIPKNKLKGLFLEVLTPFNKFKAGDKIYLQKDELVYTIL